MGLYYKYIKKYEVQFLIAIFCVTFEAFCDLLVPTMMSKMIQNGIEGSSLHAVMLWGRRMLFVTAIGAVLATLRNNLSGIISQKATADLREDLFRKILHLSEESYHEMTAGSLITRMTNDTSQIARFINGTMRIFLKAPITCIGSIVLATMLNFRLSIMIYAVVAIVGGLIVLSMKVSYLRFYKLQKAYDDLNAKVMEYLLGIRLVKAFGTYDMEVDKFNRTNQRVLQNNISAQVPVTVISPLLTFTAGVGSAAVVYIGSFFYHVNLANAGEITAFTVYMAQILTSLVMITNIFSVFVRTKASKERIEVLFRMEEEGTKQSKAKNEEDEVDQSRREHTNILSFAHVSFAYPKSHEKKVLDDISFEMKQGETIAVIGPTGSGKTTLLSLLLAFYENFQGKIYFQNSDIKKLGINHIRKEISYVPQKAMLFYGSVESNLKWGNEKAKEDYVDEQIKRANAEFIYRLKEGKQTFIEQNGVNLSGGQKQRISIARGFIKKAKLYLLDDVTSALDAITEAKILENLKNRKDSILFVTQKCSSARWADKILVLSEGKNVGFGTHDQLLKSCLTYQQIYQSQMQGYAWEEEECSKN